MKDLCQDKKSKDKRNTTVPVMASMAALMLSACATNTAAQSNQESKASSIPTENKEKDAIIVVKESMVTQSMKSVIQFSFNKEFSGDVKASANPKTNQIILDFEGVDRAFKLPPVIENDPLVSKISMKLINKQVRVVVETKHPVKFKFLKQEMNGILILDESTTFENGATGEKYVLDELKAPAKISTSGLSSNWTEVVSKNPSVQVSSAEDVKINSRFAFSEINNVNLKKVGQKNTKLTITLSNKVDAPIIKKDGTKLIIDFTNVSIPNELQRRVNTESVGTVTQSLDVSMQQSNGRIILEQKENWDYSFYQLENQVVIEVKAIDKKEDAKKYVGKKLSISFQDMEVRAILQVIADFTGLNIMSSDQVTGTMTIRLKDVPWDQALDLVLESRGLQKVKDGNVIWVATSKEVKENNDSKIALKNQQEELGELKLEFFQINYYKAEDLKNVIENKDTDNQSNGQSRKFLSSKGSVGVDPRNNMIFIQDTEEKLKEIRGLIKKLDIANKQVLIEAKIVIADSSFGKDIGTKFGIRYRNQIGDNTYGIGGNIVESGAVAGGSVDPVTSLTNLASAGINAVAPGVIGLTLLRASGNALGIELSALEQNNRGKVLSNPRLLTADNKKAVIEQGTEVPYVTPGTNGSAPTVTFKKAVLKLEVTPQIAPNGKVVMDLNIRKDTIGQLIPIQGGGQIPAIDTKNINTMVTVNNGQTVVLGGVYEIATKDDLSKIPFFGDLPILGNLFKHTAKNEVKGELMIFITPYIIEEKDLDESQVVVPPEVNLSKK